MTERQMEPDQIVAVVNVGEPIVLYGSGTITELVERRWWEFWRPRAYFKTRRTRP